MTPPEGPYLIIQSVLALAHLLPLLYVFWRREKRYGLILYCLLSVTWGLGVVLATHGFEPLSAQVAHVADYVRTDVPVLLVALLLPLALRNFDRPSHHWAWGTGGAIWATVALGLHVALGPDAAGARLATVLALVGWLILSCLVVAFSARWTLRAPLAFYRNRGIYWLALLVLLLAGQGLILVQAQWGGIGLGLHLLGTAGAVICIMTRHLPGIKGFLRSAVSNIVLTVTTALLFLVGLLTALLLLRTQRNPAAILIGSAVVAIGLALIYRTLHRSLTWLVNRLLWRERADMDRVVRDYGRTIGSLLTLEQLATVAIGIISETLEVQRGVLIVLSKAGYQIILRAIEGKGQVDNKEMTIPLNSPLLLYLMMTSEPFLQYDLTHHPDLQEVAPQERDWMRALGMEIYVPILAHGRLLGLLALGLQRSGEPYSPQDVAFLTMLAQQTGVSLQNAYLFDEMRNLYAKIARLNEDLRQAYAKLKKLDQAKADFLSIASHELRTPLTVIQGYTDILEELATARSLSPEQVAEIVENLKAPTTRLAAIVTAMLDASQIEVQALDLHFTSTTLQVTMNMAIAPWRDAIEERHLDLTMESIEGIPPIEVDVQRLCQAFGNVISNAVKYTPDEGHITITASLPDAEHFEVVIADTGVGVDPRDQVLIFEKFYRVGDLLRHSTGETKFMGAGPGLGLHIAKGVIEAHGGRIWVESEGYDEERCPGSAFHVLLPLQAVTPAAEEDLP